MQRPFLRDCRAFTIRCFALLMLFVSAISAPAMAQIPEGMGKPAMWVVRDADTTIYLFGTVHALPPGLQWYNPHIASTLAGTAELVTEVPENDDYDLSHVVMTYGFAQDSVPLSRRLTREQYARYAGAMRRSGLQPAMFERAAPWLPAVILERQGARADNWRRSLGVETRLWRAAREGRLTNSGLENAYFQLSFYGILSLESQTQLLDETLSYTAADDVGMRAHLNAILRAWHAGDTDALGQLVDSERASNPEFHDVILTERNTRWAQWIRLRLNEQGGNFFVAVGAAHLSGSDSVQVQLARIGITAERVHY